MLDVDTSVMVENGHVREEGEVDVQISQTQTHPQTTRWSNGQVVLAVQSCSLLNPKFDLSVCRAQLENGGFQIPVGDLEAPLRMALDTASVRRFLVFNSAVFQLILAPVLYVVLWCSVFSTLHVHVTISDWVLCLVVTLFSIFPTIAIIFILQHSNKELNMNIDVRLIQVNERMVKHKLLVAVADWMQNCTGHMKLYFVYWDISHCLRTLTETFEKRSAVVNIQAKLKKKMSHLILVTEVTADDDGGASDVEQGSAEQRPLLKKEKASCSTATSPEEGAQVTANYSLLPDSSLPDQAKAYQLLMTYSAVYVKLLVSERLKRRHPRPLQENHCSTASFCLCQFIEKKIVE
ncbi:transmembrane protein 268 [Antennarius striatus]|uniref:transmembrane protein 268 n=1 Tax=Antennarius striatus TaxID=241820 RepID=UPI0035AE100B